MKTTRTSADTNIVVKTISEFTDEKHNIGSYVLKNRLIKLKLIKRVGSEEFLLGGCSIVRDHFGDDGFVQESRASQQTPLTG